MLTPDELAALPESLMDMYGELNIFVLEDIARRIKKAGEITETAEFQMYVLQALGESNRAIRDKTAEITGLAKAEVNRLLKEAAKRSDEFDRRVFKAAKAVAIPLEENEALQQILAAQIKQAGDNIENITKTMGFADLDVNGKVVFQEKTAMLRKLLNEAHAKIITGATDPTTAIRQATNKLIDSGVRTINYESGHTERVDVAVRRAVMTGTSQVTNRISEANAELFGADGWEISAHAGARPSHAIHQGRQFPQSQYETIVKPLIDDYNCRHSAFPIIMGVTEPMYTEEQLAHIDPPPIEYEGKMYTAYEATQQQRKMERYIRKQKERCVVAEAADDKEAFTTASIRLKRQESIYKDFSEQAGLYTRSERMQVHGFGRSQAQKAVWANKKETEILDFIQKDAIIKESSGLPKKVSLPDEKLKQTVNVELPNLNGVVPKGADLANVYCMAGENTSTPIRDIKRLYEVHGGDMSKWQKKSGDAYAKNYKYVVHWYENDGKAVEYKLKGVGKL